MNTTFIIKRRKEKKLTQAEVAKRLAVNRQTYIRWERGGDFPCGQLESLGVLLDFKLVLIPNEML